jgi:hypothetical protein
VTRRHLAVELNLDTATTTRAAILATLRGVHDTARVRGGLTAPELSDAAGQLDDWLRNRPAPLAD